MVLILLIAMIGVPILEIIVFIEAGGVLGTWPTVGAVVLTAIIGTALLRQQGLSTLARAQENLSAGRLPMNEVFDGLCIVIGGALLLTPGFITDTIGFLLLIPPVRRLIRTWSGQYLARKTEIHTWTDASAPSGRPESAGDGPVIDGQFEEVEGREGETADNSTSSSDTRRSPGWGRRERPPTVVRPDDP